MATKIQQFNTGGSKPQRETPLFEPFPEPKAWALNWDYEALKAPQRPSSGSAPK